MPRFTVVMPAFNASRTIEAAIASVLAQTSGDWELVVVDDGSTDGTAGLVERGGDQRVRLLRRANGGPSAARNAALEVARGDLVSFLDADDLWLPGYLETMDRALTDAPEAGFAFTDAWVLDDATGRIRRRTAMAYQRPPSGTSWDAATLLGKLARTNFVYTSTTVRTEVLERVGGFRTSLLASEDYELWLRIAAHGYGAVRPPGVLAIHRERAGSQSADPRRMYESLATVYTIVAEEYDVPDAIRAQAAGQAEAWEARLRILVAPAAVSPGRWLRRLVHRVRHGPGGRREWLREPPRELLPTLRLVGGVGTIARRDAR